MSTEHGSYEGWFQKLIDEPEAVLEVHKTRLHQGFPSAKAAAQILANRRAVEQQRRDKAVSAALIKATKKQEGVL